MKVIVNLVVGSISLIIAILYTMFVGFDWIAFANFIAGFFNYCIYIKSRNEEE